MQLKKITFSLLILTLSLSLNTHHTLAADPSDTISANASLSGDQTIVSAGGYFRLGFYKPGNASKFYIAIWYNGINTQTAVWVANRNRPVADKSTAHFRILGSNLVLLDHSKTEIWSTASQTSTSSSSNATAGPLEAVLLNSGNLVLRRALDPNSRVWQSFDHPTDTWLPGVKLALNKRTGRSQRLTSWTNSEDPAPGLFSLEPDPNGTSEYIILWNGTRPYWGSGTWDYGRRIFSQLPEMELKNQYHFDDEYVSNAEENYFTYSFDDPSVVLRIFVHVSGQIKVATWNPEFNEWYLFWTQPRQQCEVNDYCGVFGICNDNVMPSCSCLHGFRARSEWEWGLQQYSSGCVRSLSLQCGNNITEKKKKDRDRFLLKPNMKLPDSPQSAAADSSAGCEMACLNNYDCTAYAYDSNSSRGCSVWTGNLVNLQQLSAGDSSGKNLYIRLNKAEFPDGETNKSLVIGIVSGLTALVMAILGVFTVILLCRCRRRKQLIATAKAMKGSLVAFEYRGLRDATKNFSEKLGGGGFGSVFKGTLPDSAVIAVKKLNSISQGEKQFRMEVSTIGMIQHLNLVRLRGFCSQGAKKLLVYDYVPNGSLDAHLFRRNDLNRVLDWKTRFRIALGTARGLAYLHEKCRDCIIHCDIKPENILLDAEFCPKVADFGLAKLLGRDFSRVLTTFRGTKGYLAPEWISGLPITPKADVYSFGMMLFELISGRRNSQGISKEGENSSYFPNWVATRLTEGGDLVGLLDHKLEGNADPEELVRVCRVACWCIQDDEAHRPSMGQVVPILEGVSEVNLPPIPRSLQLLVDNQEHIVFFTESSSNESSIADQFFVSYQQCHCHHAINKFSNLSGMG